MTAAVINRDPDQYSCTDDAFDAQMISDLIDVHLLRRFPSLPTTQDSPCD